MATKKRKKNTRQRAGTTHGWGARKKHRGSGNRGGVGNAGSGKRAHCKKPSFWGRNYFGMNGFKKKGLVIEFCCVNVGDLSKYAKSGKLEINLADHGINKLLGGGKADQAYKITVEYATSSAIEKIKEAKGTITVQNAQDSVSSGEKSEE